MAELSLNDWQVESLRLSAFMVDVIDPAKTRCWESLVGKIPDELRSQPQQQLVVEEGPFLNGRLLVEARRNRFDWRLIHDLNNPSHEFPVMGSYDALESRFRDLMLKWLADCPPIHRVAYGGVLLLPAESQLDAYKKLDGLLPAVDIDPENTRDLTYRINRRRNSRCEIEGLKINRLSTWSVAQIVDTLVEMSAGGHHPPKVMQSPNSRNICRLELDINTVPEFVQELDKRLLPEIFNELVDTGNEIAAKGDVS